MAATSLQLAPANDTDANFRLWGKAISDQMLAGGWVQTADTGQINWATVTRPTALNEVKGYEMWRSNDAGGGLTEFYLKIEYGGLMTAGVNSGIWLTVGWTTNGTGTLTGVVSDRILAGNSTNGSGNSTTLFWSNLSTAVGRAQIVMFTGDALFTSASKGWAFSIERLRNAAFAQTNNILILVYRSNSTTNSQTIANQTVTPTLAYASVTSSAGGSAPLQADIVQANAVVSGEAGVGLQFGQMGGLTAPSSNIFSGVTTSMGAAQTNDIKITTYGTERNYIINAGSPFFNGTSSLILSRFE